MSGGDGDASGPRRVFYQKIDEVLRTAMEPERKHDGVLKRITELDVPDNNQFFAKADVSATSLKTQLQESMALIFVAKKHIEKMKPTADVGEAAEKMNTVTGMMNIFIFLFFMLSYEGRTGRVMKVEQFFGPPV